MTNTTRSNELNSVVASLLAPTNVSSLPTTSSSYTWATQQDGGGQDLRLAASPAHMADVPVEMAPVSGTSPEFAPQVVVTVQGIQSVQGGQLIEPVSPVAAMPSVPFNAAAPQFAGGEIQPLSVQVPAGEAVLPLAPPVSMDVAAAGPDIAVAVAHDETIGVFCMCTACMGGSDKPAPPSVIGPAAGDDIPDDISSTVTIAVGGTLVSSIQTAGDKDYIKVSLVAGQTYTFSLESNGLVDPYVELRDGTNVLLKENDDGGILYESFLTYTATATADYFIAVRDYGSDVGGYSLTVKSIPTGNSSPNTFIDNGKTQFSWDEAAIQISRTGASWATDFDTSAVVTYAYRSTAPTTMPSDTAGFTRFTAAQIAANEAALAAWAEVANITFLRAGTGTSGEAAYSNTATMLFSNYGSGASGAAAFAYLPTTANASTSSAQGDVWINSSLSYNSNPVIGDYGPHVLLHEIGHAIGLSHPGEYNAAPGVSITYPANAEYFNDSRMFTSMSYFGSSSTGGNLQAFASTPSLHDIAAVQRLYGANMTTRTGDTVYGFNSNTGVAAFTLTLPSQVSVFSIWDAGGNDTLDLSGYAQNATIDLREEAFSSAGGGTYNISIARGAVIEAAIGGSGNDTVTGNAANNTLNGGAGFDTLNGNDGNDLLVGGAGGDVLNGGAGTDTASYESSSDYVFVDLQSGTVFGGDASSDTISAVENLIGTTFNDTLGGDANANTLSGLAGNDTLVGRGGNDTIDTGSGDDIVDGGDGSDTINLGAFFTALDSINGGANSDTLNLNGDYSAGITLSDTTLTNVERINVTAGNSYRLTLADATVAAGAQLIVDGTTLASGQTLTLIGTAETDGTFDLRGGAGNDDLRGGAGNDILSGGAGADVLAGGGGNDTATYANSSAGVTINIEAGTATGGDATGDTFTSIENLTGSAQNDTLTGDGNANILTGGAGNDTLSGGGGNDELNGGVGADVLIGGAGTSDVATYGTSSAAVSIDLQAGTASGGDATGDSLIGIEDLTGSSLGDALLGDATANVIRGSGGNDVMAGRDGDDTLIGGEGSDWISGGSGANTLIGGTGDETYIVDGVGDTVIENAGEGTDGVWTSLLSFTLSANVENLVFAGTGNFSGTGNDLNNLIFGGSGNDALVGGAGNDALAGGDGNDTLTGGEGADWISGALGANTLIGGSGDETYIVDGIGDTVVENAGEGTDGVWTSLLSFTLSANVENLVFAGTGNFSGTGNGLSNLIFGGSGNDTLAGDAGNDVLAGGGGNDTLTGGEGSDWISGGSGANTLIGGTGDETYIVDGAGDTVIENAGEGTDGVWTSLLSFTLSANVENLVFAGVGNFSGTGNELNNMIYGGSGNDALAGGAGNDVLAGGDGNDTLTGGEGSDWISGGSGANTVIGGAGDETYIVDGVGDTVIENAGEGTDGVWTSLLSFTLSANVENLVFAGTGNFSGTGNGQSNLIFGGSGNDTLSGLAGSDTLTGGAGDDIFVFSDTDGIATDTIADFDASGNDVIRLTMAGILTFADIQARMTQVGADVLLNFDTTDILLSNTTLASVTADDFIFGGGGGG
jgi:Ca2+-binding RTX toxin-like protein